jgi:hypothetical protein
MENYEEFLTGATSRVRYLNFNLRREEIGGAKDSFDSLSSNSRHHLNSDRACRCVAMYASRVCPSSVTSFASAHSTSI